MPPEEPPDDAAAVSAPLLTPVTGRGTTDAVVEQIEALLADGRLAVGDRLPAERRLADELGVSRASVREALRVLQGLGVVRITSGLGRTSSVEVVARPAQAIGAALRVHVATAHLPVADVVEARVVLETAAAGLLAGRAPTRPELTEPAAELLARMAALGDDREAFLGLDTEFHLALAQAAGNAVLAVMLSSLREAVQDYVRRAAGGLPAWQEEARRLHGEHAGLLAAVRAGDVALAQDAVRAHIEGFHRRARA